MDFLEDLFDFDRKKKGDRKGYGDHHDHEHDRHEDDRHDHHNDSYHHRQNNQSPYNSVVCVSCSFNNLPGSNFCSKCGLKLGNNICRGCGMKLQPGSAFCSGCGTKA